MHLGERVGAAVALGGLGLAEDCFYYGFVDALEKFLEGENGALAIGLDGLDGCVFGDDCAGVGAEIPEGFI